MSKKKTKLKYFLDHPQIKRKKAWGNGNTPLSSIFSSNSKSKSAKPSSTTSTSSSSTKGSKPSLAEQINFGGKFDK